jgi:RimJ/RimL family protein N-acetyltransferase
MESFSTNRLTAGKLHEGHLADLVSLHLDPDVSRYLGGVRSADVTKTYLEINMAHWDQYGFGLWVLKTHDGEFAGRAGIRHVVVDDIDEVEIAYTFKRTLWGQGLASEIAHALTGIGLSHFKLPSLVGLVFVEHKASRRVLEKSGFSFERDTIFRGEIVVYRSPTALNNPEPMHRLQNG